MYVCMYVHTCFSYVDVSMYIFCFYVSHMLCRLNDNLKCLYGSTNQPTNSYCSSKNVFSFVHSFRALQEQQLHTYIQNNIKSSANKTLLSFLTGKYFNSCTCLLRKSFIKTTTESCSEYKKSDWISNLIATTFGSCTSRYG